MTTGKLYLAAFLAAMPALAAAQPSVNVDVGVNVGIDTVAPGDPVESVEVFYDQLSPYGVWVDEPDVGRAFIPDLADYVPYRVGHWQYTNLGFVWISSEPFGWATSHYGRWAYSRFYGRWYWLPDTAWGPAWVEWRQTGTDFGWAPLPPDIVLRAGWQPPVEVWHYCAADHLLDVNLVRYYRPRERVVEIHRAARPVEHYATVSNVRVVVGPPATTLRERRIAVRPVKVEARTVGRWTQTEARAQVERARTHRVTFETQNQRRIESNVKIRTAHTRVIEAHPQIKAQVTARIQGRATPPDDKRAPATAPTSPERNGPGQRDRDQRETRPTPNTPDQQPREQRPAQPNRDQRPEPRGDQRDRDQRETRPTPNAPGQQPRDQRPAEPSNRDQRPSDQRGDQRGRDQRETRPTPNAPGQQPRDQRPAEPSNRDQRPEPRGDQRGRDQRPAEPPPREHAAPTPPANRPTPAPRAEPSPRAPEPKAQPETREPPRGAERREPERREPERRQPDRKDSDRKESDRKDDRR